MPQAKPTMPDRALLLRQAAEDAALAIQEDLGDGDLSALAAEPQQRSVATVLCRQQAVLCGRLWFEAVFKQLDATAAFDWKQQDGQALTAGLEVVRLTGRTRALLTGERSALNFLQTLSGTASLARQYAQQLDDLPGTDAVLLDTRKTLPLLRVAQKYAIAAGGVHNHRLGLWDAVMLKENHIAAAGGITRAVQRIRSRAPDWSPDHKPLIVEVERAEQLEEAIAAGATQILLDNFAADRIAEAVEIVSGRCRLEISGGISADDLARLTAAGVDCISVGALTKNLQAVDFSMQLLP